MFRKRLSNLVKLARRLNHEGIINDGSYCDYMVLIWRARTLDQLDQIAHDLVELSRPPDHPLSIQ